MRSAISLIIISLSIVHVRSETLVDANGRSIEAEIIGVSDTFVSVTTEAEIEYDIPIHKLSSNSQLLIELWSKQREIEDRLSKHVTPLQTSVEFNPIHDDDKTQKAKRYYPTVKTYNKDPNFNYKNLKGTLIIIGNSHYKKTMRRVLYKQTFAIDLPSNSSSVWGGESFSIRKGKFGHDIGGYILLIQNQENEFIYSYGTSPLWVKAPERALNLLELADYDKSLKNPL